MVHLQRERNNLEAKEDALSDRILRLLPAIRRYFNNRTTASEVEDLTQEVYVNMLRRPRDLGIENLEGYLFQVAANVLAAKGRHDRARRSANHVELTDKSHPVEEVSPERILMQRQLLKSMSDAILELPQRTRDIFVLHRFEEMTYQAIARRMGLSVSSVEKHMIKAIRILTHRFQSL